jgi:hypothetical protein
MDLSLREHRSLLTWLHPYVTYLWGCYCICSLSYVAVTVQYRSEILATDIQFWPFSWWSPAALLLPFPAYTCVWQVLELHGLTELPVRRPPQLHGNTHRSLQAGVRIGRGPEHNGHLSVHISLRKGASGLPARSREIHFNVLCQRQVAV